MINISEIIKNEREKQNLTQEKLARMCGLTTATIINVEKGYFEPRVPTLVKILNALHLDLDIIE